jgi:hypothetical protein
MFKNAAQPTVKVRLVRDHVIVGNRVHQAGDSVTMAEDQAIRLEHEGGATFAPGVTLSGDGRALQAELAKSKVKPAKPRPDAPLVRVRCVAEDRPIPAHLPMSLRSKPTFIVGGRVMVPGDESEVREDDAAEAMAAHPLALGLAPGSEFSPRGDRYHAELSVPGRGATY